MQLSDIPHRQPSFSCKNARLQDWKSLRRML
nr:MAG TPA: hypothetical protein [Caudoviricetes sp.]